DEFAPRGSCDFHEEFATPLPSGIFLPLMGLPREDLPLFLKWRDELVRPEMDMAEGETAEGVRRRAALEVRDHFPAACAERRKHPGGGRLSTSIDFEIDGNPPSDRDLLGMSPLLPAGAPATATATLDCMVVSLAPHPAHRQQLIDDPSCIPAAVEELLR